MNTEWIDSGELNVKRILMDMDAWGASASLMQSAVSLASRLQAELFGLFVEDAELLHAADLPFTREISLASARHRDLDAASIIRFLQIEADKLRRQMETLATSSKINWSFNVARGEHFEQLFEKCDEFELIIFMPRRYYLIKRYQNVAMNMGGPVTVLLEGGIHSLRSLQVIKYLIANGSLTQLHVLSQGNVIEEKAKTQLAQMAVPVSYKTVSKVSVPELSDYIRLVSPSLMVLPFLDEWRQQPAEIKSLLDQLSCPLILVR